MYKARLKSSGKYVAVKVQRPQMLETVSKDLYVMKRAVEVRFLGRRVVAWRGVAFTASSDDDL